jgi:hypothetical protein
MSFSTEVGPGTITGGAGRRALVSGGEDVKIKFWPIDGAGEPVVLTQGSSVLALEVLADGRLAVLHVTRGGDAASFGRGRGIGRQIICQLMGTVSVGWRF